MHQFDIAISQDITGVVLDSAKGYYLNSIYWYFDFISIKLKSTIQGTANIMAYSEMT